MESFNQSSIRNITKENIKINLHDIYKANQEVVSNFYTFDFTSSKGIALYSINVSHKISGTSNSFYSLIKKMQKNPIVKQILKEHFIDFWITGNSLFGKPYIKDSIESSKLPKVSFKVGWKDSLFEVRKIEEPEFEYEDVFTFTLFWKYNLQDYNEKNISKNEKEHVRRFINIIIQKYLEGMGYLKTEPGQKAVYYKKGFEGDHMIPIAQGVYFVSGYKVSSNFYDNNEILVKTVQKFRMIREQSYLDYYLYKKNQGYFRSNEEFETYFNSFIKNRCGLSRHTEKKIRINLLIYNVNIDEYKFQRKEKKGDEVIESEISMYEYYKQRYNIDLYHKVQPLAEEVEIRKGFNNQKIIKKIYFPLELLFILGKIEDIDNFDITKATLLPPTEKFNRTHKLMRELKANINKINLDEQKIVKSTNLNFNLKTIKSGILRMPIIEFGENRIVNPDINEGVFDIKGSKPLINEDLKDWIIFSYDCLPEEIQKIGNMFGTAKLALGISFKDPHIEAIPSNLDKNSLIQAFTEYFNTLFNKKKSGNKIAEFAMLILSKRKEYIYQYFKNAINNSGVKLRSQVVKKESILKKGLTVASNILLQIWAKRGLPLWKSKELKHQINIKKVMVAGYAVAYSPKTKQGITALSASLNSDFTEHANFCEFHDIMNKTSPHIGILLSKAVELYKKINKKYPNRIILYREGLSTKQRDTAFRVEVEKIKQEDSLRSIGITIIFVNKQCDIRFYLDENKLYERMNNLTLTDQTYDSKFELDISKISLADEKLYTNISPGSVIENGITEEGNNEFYIVSTYSRHGTCSPTHYIVQYDENEINKNIIYKITYDLTFLYYNNNKCIRIPLPLQSATRMVNHASKYLDKSSNNIFDYNFGY